LGDFGSPTGHQLADFGSRTGHQLADFGSPTGHQFANRTSAWPLATAVGTRQGEKEKLKKK
jgi:hypothetical protein